MRYKINFDKTVNQLIPHFFSGRKLVLFIQSMIAPLQIVNDEFVKYAKKTRTEAAMTSQKIKFEKFLNNEFSGYFLNGGNITITGERAPGVPIYFEAKNDKGGENIILHNQNENKNSLSLYLHDEKREKGDVSFVVNSPSVDTSLIKLEDYKARLTYYIEKYRLAGKTYKINIMSNERI